MEAEVCQLYFVWFVYRQRREFERSTPRGTFAMEDQAQPSLSQEPDDFNQDKNRVSIFFSNLLFGA